MKLFGVDNSFYVKTHGLEEKRFNNTDELDLTFEAEYEDVDQEYACRTPSRARRVPVELKPGGCAIAVTEENRIEYLELFVEHRLVGAIQLQIEAFRKGLGIFLKPNLLGEFRQLCDPADAQLLLCGTADIDLDDWLAHTEYKGLSSDAPVACYFWDVVRSMSAEHRSKLLHFCTGSSRGPAAGFARIRGYNGQEHRFTLQLQPDRDVEHLPVAATCFNTLKLPEYTSEHQARNKIITAITFAGGFDEGAVAS